MRQSMIPNSLRNFYLTEGFDRYRLKGRVTKIMEAVPRIVTERPRESVIKPKTIGEIAPEPNVTA